MCLSSQEKLNVLKDIAAACGEHGMPVVFGLDRFQPQDIRPALEKVHTISTGNCSVANSFCPKSGAANSTAMHADTHLGCCGLISQTTPHFSFMM